MHIDAAYAGSAFICPEFRHLLNGVEVNMSREKLARLAGNFGFRKKKLYYPNSKNKSADQLRSYCNAGLHLCFRIGQNPVLPRVQTFAEWS